MDETYMRRCLDLARLGLGSVAPNPMVGSVIVANGKIIGEGWHQKCGEAHAEVNAINTVKDQLLLQESTLYVNLEPCAHYGKTPPCSKLIIEKKIPKVVIACVDPFAQVAGKGIEMLREAGVEVVVGVLEKEAKFLNRRFFTFHEQKRPFIILKWAETSDGFIDIIRKPNDDTPPTWITNQLAKALVHKWRTEEPAIMVGTNTAELDNPQLTVRNWEGKNPVRVVLDKDLRLTNNLYLFDQTTSTIVFTAKDEENKVNLEFEKIDFSANMLTQCFEKLYQRNIQSIIVEGGSVLLNSLIEAGLWDETRVFIGSKYFIEGVIAPRIKGKPISEDEIGDSKLFIYQNN